ncbi:MULTISPECIES: hypothetical protein [Haloferax]|uniref:Uncharacterized protein n=1 Tax=Haloferax marinum TaxID=2666143 RepID=A0A6A8G5R4_9EURY|nr:MULTISPECIES: hypothetical protein [Haloferax]MRW95958.1 hypothetical protein [Haloferax marinum]
MLGLFDSMSLFLYGAIAVLAGGFWVWVVGSYVYGWTSPGDVVDQNEK